MGGNHYYNNNENGAQYYYEEDEVEVWADSEEGVDLYFVIFLTLLAIALTFSKFLHDSPRVSAILPEAGMIIILGALAGVVLWFVTPVSEQTLSDDAVADDDGAAADGQHVEEDISLFVAEGLLSFSPKVFFFVLLPPIIFNSGYTLKREVFFRHIGPISLFACAGTAISAFAIAFFLQMTKDLGLLGNFSPRFTELLSFGALISATDPVSTLAVFQAKQVDPQLFYLVFGESVLNDAVGLVLFKTTSKLVGNEDDIGKVATVVVQFLVDFSVGFIGSMILGFLSGIVCAFFLKKIDMRHTPLLELSFFFLNMYLPFFVAELFELSGIVAILFTGISLRRYATHNLSESTEETADQIFRLVAHLAETSIFLELGLCVVKFPEKVSDNWKFSAYAALACLIGRALNVYPLRTLYNLFLRRKENEDHFNHAFDISSSDSFEFRAKSVPNNDSMLNEQPTLTPARRKDLKVRNNTAHMLWFAGLRGAVAYACAKEFPNAYGNREVFVFTTMALVLFTVFVFGCTTDAALSFFQIEVNVDEEKYMDDNDTIDKMMFINKFEIKYIYPKVIRDYDGNNQTDVHLTNLSVIGEDSTYNNPSTVGPNQSPVRRLQSNDRASTADTFSSRGGRRNTSIYDYGHTVRRPKMPAAHRRSLRMRYTSKDRFLDDATLIS